jgi:hypothetical protein
MSDFLLVSRVTPCLNEKESIKSCIAKIQNTFAKSHRHHININGEIVSYQLEKDVVHTVRGIWNTDW